MKPTVGTDLSRRPGGAMTWGTGFGYASYLVLELLVLGDCIANLRDPIHAIGGAILVFAIAAGLAALFARSRSSYTADAFLTIVEALFPVVIAMLAAEQWSRDRGVLDAIVVVVTAVYACWKFARGIRRLTRASKRP